MTIHKAPTAVRLSKGWQIDKPLERGGFGSVYGAGSMDGASYAMP